MKRRENGWAGPQVGSLATAKRMEWSRQSLFSQTSDGGADMQDEILMKISLMLESDCLSYRLYLENVRTAIQLGLI